MYNFFDKYFGFSQTSKEVNEKLSCNGISTFEKPQAKGLGLQVLENTKQLIKYATDVEAKATEETERRQRVEALIERFVPQDVAMQLVNGMSIEQKYYPNVTILSSEIVGFKEMISHADPMKVM